MTQERPEKPTIRPDLVEWLEYIYPNKLPINLEDATPVQVACDMGVQRIIAYLRYLMEEQGK